MSATTTASYQAILPRPLPSHVPVGQPQDVVDTTVADGRPRATVDPSERPIPNTIVDDADDVNPTPTPPGLAGRAAAFRTVQPLDLGPMNILCDFCEARH